MKLVLVVQARTGSTRLPQKVLADLEGQTVFWHVLNRAQHIPGLAARIVTLYDLPEDRILVAMAERQSFEARVAIGVKVGDVLGRYIDATQDFDEDTAVIRVTADCPLFDPGLCADGLRLGIDALTMGTNSPVETTGWFDGLDYEVVPLAMLRQAHREATSAEDRAHVTRWIRQTQFGIGFVGPRPSEQEILDQVPRELRKWSVDTPDDLRLVRRLVAANGPDANWRTHALSLIPGATDAHS